MVQDLQLNIIPFTAPFKQAKLAFYTQREEGSYPIFKGYLGALLDDKFSSERISADREIIHRL